MRTHRLDNYLKTYRKRSGFSQEHLAYLMGTGDLTTVSRCERNENRPSFDALLAYEEVFGVASSELFAGCVAKVRTRVRRRAAFLRRRLEAQPQTPKTLRELESLSRISNRPR